MTNAHRNQDRTFEVVTVDTDTLVCVEKCRNSLGSWAKMMDRLATRFGSQLSSDDEGQTWKAGGLHVRLLDVMTF